MPQQPTVFDAWTGVISAALYVVVGIAALTYAPSDRRARTFFAVAIASLAPYLFPALSGRIGTGRLMSAAAVAIAASLAVGSVALFHFAQVFPSRRPWIRKYGVWLGAAYAVLPVAAVIGTWALLPVLRVMSEMSSQAATMSTGGGIVD